MPPTEAARWIVAHLGEIAFSATIICGGIYLVLSNRERRAADDGDREAGQSFWSIW